MQISTELKTKIPHLRLGIIIADVTVTQTSDALKTELENSFQALLETIQVTEISSIENINKTRAAYRALGKDPTKYRGSSEKLLRRVLKGQGLDFVNNIVDLTNLISIHCLNPVGTYDLEKVTGTCSFDFGRAGETYLNIGSQNMNVENLPIMRDEVGPFGSTTSDSLKTSIQTKTKKIIMNITAFNEADNLEQHIDDAVDLIKKYAQGQIEKAYVLE